MAESNNSYITYIPVVLVMGIFAVIFASMFASIEEDKIERLDEFSEDTVPEFEYKIQSGTLTKDDCNSLVKAENRIKNWKNSTKQLEEIKDFLQYCTKNEYGGFSPVNNIYRPTPDNFVNAGASIIFSNGTTSEFVILHLANGLEFMTDCPKDHYPQWQNSTHFQCGDNDYKTWRDFEMINYKGLRGT